MDLEKVGQRTLWVDCDVLQADGGTRTAAITGGYVALVLALRKLGLAAALRGPVAAVSTGVVAREPCLDLCYTEDVAATVDFNLVMNSAGEFIEIQGAGEEATFSQAELDGLLGLGKAGIAELLQLQRAALGEPNPG